MGHNSSKGSGKECSPFPKSLHLANCYLRKLIEKRDFVLFISEIKTRLKDSAYCCGPPRATSLYGLNNLARAGGADAAGGAAEGCEDILSYKVRIGQQESHFLYMTCNCQGRYMGMDINKLDTRGQTALHVAIRKKDRKIIKIILNNGGDPCKHSKWGVTPLHVACEIGDLDTVYQLLELGADPDVKEVQDLSMFTNQERTALIVAASHGHGHCVGTLLKAGANPSISDSNGNMPLHKAAVYGHLGCVKALLASGADPNFANNIGATPLQLALMQRHSNVVQLLLRHNCDVSIYSTQLPSVMTLAATIGEEEVLKRCIDKESSSSSQAKDKETQEDNERAALYYTFTVDIPSLQAKYNAISTQGVMFDIKHFQLTRRRDTFNILIDRGVDMEWVLLESIKSNTLTVKHYTFPQNIELFKMCICACGFGRISESQIDALFWKLVGSNSTVLIRTLLCAVPRLDHHIQCKLKDVVDWAGTHTDDSVHRYLENAGIDPATALWVNNRTRKPRSLQEWCRESIRRSMAHNVIYSSRRLPLPQVLKTFLVLEESDRNLKDVDRVASMEMETHL